MEDLYRLELRFIGCNIAAETTTENLSLLVSSVCVCLCVTVHLLQMEYLERDREQVSLRDKIDGTRPKMNFSPRLFRMLNNNNL